MELSALQAKAWQMAEEKGFHYTAADQNIPTKLALIIGEVIEALEEYRAGKPNVYYHDGKPEGVVIELADAAIRIADTVGMLEGNLEDAVLIKMDYNKTRPQRHGRKLF